jgi:hypothetical protein
VFQQSQDHAGGSQSFYDFSDNGSNNKVIRFVMVRQTLVGCHHWPIMRDKVLNIDDTIKSLKITNAVADERWEKLLE